MYWALLKFFLNNRKIPVIPPLFHNNKFFTDFKVEAELFNSFFPKQCSLIKNDSKLPPRLQFLTDKRLSTVKFVNTDTSKIIQHLNPNKAHGHDKICIRMLKICRNSLCRPLKLIFNDCLPNGIFPYGILLTKYTNRLMKVLMSVVNFSTYLRPFIKYDSTLLLSN